MMRRLSFLGLLSLLGCAGTKDDNATPRCSASVACPEALTCYRSFCVEDIDGIADNDAGSTESAMRDAGMQVTTQPSARGDAGASFDAAAIAAPIADAAPALDAPEPVAPSVPSAPVSPIQPSPGPRNASTGELRWPWSIGRLKNVPSHLLPCLGSCTILSQQECETCIAERERGQGSGSDASCDEDDENQEDSEGRGQSSRCGRAR